MYAKRSFINGKSMDDNLQGSIINLIIDEEGESRMGHFGGQLKEAADQYESMHFKIMENN